VTGAVRLIRLSVTNVGPLAGPIELGPFAPGINVISGANEAGKSTLVEALRAGLFERHATKNRQISALQPHGTKLAPEVKIELDLGGEIVSIHKRFLDKAMAEVRFGSGPSYRDKEADEVLLARLEGKAPKKTGVTREDMGVWGLLWVTQDESAYADPGEKLDEDVRGALAETVGRQVGRVTGGRHGERIRGRVEEALARFFTTKTGAPTGEHRAAIERSRVADERVLQIEGRMREVEELSERYQAESTRLSELERSIPALVAELQSAKEEAASIEKGEARARVARMAREAAALAHDKRQGEVEDRAALVREAAEYAAEARRQRASLDELTRTAEERSAEALACRAGLDALSDELRRSRAALDEASRLLGRAHGEAERRRLRAEIARARRLDEEIAALRGERAERAIAEPVYDEIQRISQRIERLSARLSGEGTRIVASDDAGAPRSWVAAISTVLTIPGLGEVELSPARPGLAEAAAKAGKARASLGESLFGLGVADAGRARELGAARAEIEVEVTALRARLKALAPEGPSELGERAARLGAESGQREERLAQARAAQEEREQILRALAAQPVDDKALAALRERSQEVALAKAALDALGTELSIRALDRLELRFGDEAGDVLLAGAEATRTVSGPTTIRLGDLAEITLSPRGEDRVKAAARLGRAERELGALLQSVGAQTIAEAEAAARARTELASQRAAVEQRLAGLAPRGVDALRIEAEERRAEAEARRVALASAREVAARIGALEQALADNRVSAEAMTRITTLEGALAACEAEVEQRAARLRLIAGPLAERLGAGRVIAIAERTGLDLPGSTRFELVPGEAAEGGELREAELSLEGALRRAGAGDLADARARYRAGLALDEQLGQRAAQREAIAPGGREALELRLDALSGGAGSAEDDVASALEALDPAVLGARVEALRAEVREAEARRASLEQECARREEESASLGRAVAELGGRWSAAKGAQESAEERLAERRSVVADEALRARLGEAAEALARAMEAEAGEDLALLKATPELLRDEVKRAADVLAARQEALKKLSFTVVELRTLLERAASEGRFEELSDAKAEQADAQGALARMEREARAVRLLAEQVEEAYSDAQRIFLGPVLNEAAPYLSNLRPGTELKMTRDLRLDKVVRRGVEEDFAQLSGGTREQLSVIVRIALARVLAKDKRPLPLILDDTMGWTDDLRFLSMVKILRDASRELQLILLTCHGGRFDRLSPDYSADLDELKRRAAAR